MGGNARIEALRQNIVKQAYTSRVVQEFFIPVNVTPPGAGTSSEVSRIQGVLFQRSAILICLLHFALGDSAMH